MVQLSRGIRLVLLLSLLAACGSTAPARTEGEQVAQALREAGLTLGNLRPVPVPGNRSGRIVENQGFDIPGIRVPDGEPAGMIRIYRGTREAEAERRVYALLGQPGPQTKLDYHAVAGTRGLILNYRLPNDLAKRYLDAFGSLSEEAASATETLRQAAVRSRAPGRGYLRVWRPLPRETRSLSLIDHSLREEAAS